MKLLLIIIIIYFLLVIAGRYVLPFVLKFYVKRFSKKFNEGINNQQYEDVNKKEGEIHIDHIPEKNKSENSEVGDYVDFEEIK